MNKTGIQKWQYFENCACMHNGNISTHDGNTGELTIASNLA